MLIFKFLRKKGFRLEKLIFLPKKCIYFVTYRNEHPVYMYINLFRNPLSRTSSVDANRRRSDTLADDKAQHIHYIHFFYGYLSSKVQITL